MILFRIGGSQTTRWINPALLEPDGTVQVQEWHRVAGYWLRKQAIPYLKGHQAARAEQVVNLGALCFVRIVETVLIAIPDDADAVLFRLRFPDIAVIEPDDSVGFIGVRRTGLPWRGL